MFRIIAFLSTICGATAQLRDDVTIEGQLVLGEETHPYTLRITFAPQSAPRNYPDYAKKYRRIDAIEVTISGTQLSIPRAAYEYLWFAHQASPLYPTKGRTATFELLCADSGKSWLVRFTVDRQKLLSRELLREGKKTVVTRYPPA